MVARPVLRAGRYCLDVVVVDATSADVAAAATGATAAAIIVVDVVGRVQRGLAGVVQPVQRVLLLCCFEIFDAVLDVALPLGGSFNLRKDGVWCHRLRSLQLLHEAELGVRAAVLLGLGRDVRGRGARLEPLVAGGLLRGHALLRVPLETSANEIDEHGVVAAQGLGQCFRGRFPLAALRVGDAPGSAPGIEKQPPPGGSIDEIIRWNAQNFHDTR